jgi:hypothetical protein
MPSAREAPATRQAARIRATRCHAAAPNLSAKRNNQGILGMTTFDDRERAFEAKFAMDEEMAFRITARRNRLLGQWAAAKLGLTPEETDAYAKAVVQADFEESGDEDVIRKLVGDLTAAGIEVEEAEVRQAIEAQTVEARRQLIEAK